MLREFYFTFSCFLKSYLRSNCETHTFMQISPTLFIVHQCSAVWSQLGIILTGHILNGYVTFGRLKLPLGSPPVPASSKRYNVRCSNTKQNANTKQNTVRILILQKDNDKHYYQDQSVSSRTILGCGIGNEFKFKVRHFFRIAKHLVCNHQVTVSLCTSKQKTWTERWTLTLSGMRQIYMNEMQSFADLFAFANV